MSNDVLPRWLALAGLMIILPIATFGLIYWNKTKQERDLLLDFEAYLSPTANTEYKSFGLFDRLKIARATVPVVEELQTTGWDFTISDLRQLNEKSREFAYSLQLGPGSIRGCTFSAGPPIAGTCDEGGSLNAAQWAPAQNVDSGFAVHLGEDPHVTSHSPTFLALGDTEGFDVRSKVRIDDTNAVLHDASLLVPNPLSDGHQPIKIEEVVLGVTPILRAREEYVFDVTYDMPLLLAPMFENDSKLTVVRLAGAIEVDLRDGHPGFRAEGSLDVMNHRIGRAALEYFPGHHASLWVPRLSLPIPLPGVCFDVRDALLEVDFQEKRLRLGGGMEVQTAESFSCGPGGAEMGMVTRRMVVAALEEVRSALDLPPTIHPRGHVVLDLDDAMLCADASVNGTSLFHAALAGTQRDFYMWAPKSFRTANLDGGFWSTARLGKDMVAASWSFPGSTPWQCWNGDEGPKTDLFGSILPRASYSM